MKDIEFNPFGSRENTYQPDYDDVEDNVSPSSFGGKKSIVKILGIVFAIIVVSIYCAMFFYSHAEKRSVNEKIDTFNHSLQSVHETLSDPSISKKLRNTAQQAKEKAGQETSASKATEILANIADNTPASPPQYDKHGNADSIAKSLSTYYAACDVSQYALRTQSFDTKTMCSSFDKDARDMMFSIRSHNTIADGILGKATLNTEKYTDILKKNLQ